MPAFNAINLEPEENVDEEIDNTRGLHIDEALKRFQTALKLHALGPSHYAEAAEAYNQLFKSEIFKYPDSATDFERAERQTDPNQLPLDPSFVQDAVQADIDDSSSSLPQALYLAYKNHGQFQLDGIKHLARSEGSDVFKRKETLKKAYVALYDFSAALDHDPSDADLWRRAARVAAFLQSARTSRYCLEAAIELDDDPAVDEVEPPSLAEGFAGEDLKEQLQVLGDDIALTHPIMAPYMKRSLPAQLKKYIDPIPFLPNPIESLAVPQRDSASNDEEFSRPILQVPGPSWADLGIAIVHFVAIKGVPANAISLEIPEIPDTPEPIQQSLVERPKPLDTQQAEVRVDNTTEEPSQMEANDEPESPVEIKNETVSAAENASADRGNSNVSRKRSQSTAGLPDGDAEEVVEKRSKRIRRRETAVDDSMNTQTIYAAQLEPYQAADKHLFQTTRNMVENLGVTDRGTLDRVAELIELSALENRTAKLTQPVVIDLRDSLANFEEDVGRILLAKKEASAIGFNSFLEHSKPGPQSKNETQVFDETKGLKAFTQNVNGSWMGVSDIAFEWVKAVSKTYLDSKWSDAMKTAVVQVISHLDEDIFNRMQYELGQYRLSKTPDEGLVIIDQTVQMLFELHLDVYERITNPNSAVDFGIRVETKGRLGRWFSFASLMSRDRPSHFDNTLSVRFLWAAVFSVTLTEGVSRDHVLHCWQSLRDTLAADYEDINFRLPNNAIMPEISTIAADREISKLTTMDFFLGIFQDDLSDPVSVIENLEPVLNPTSVCIRTTTQAVSTPTADSSTTPGNQHETPEADDEGLPITETANQGLRDLWKFLLGASTELRLFLWTRLGEAYHAINYTTKQFSCNLRSIEMVVNDFERDPYLSMPVEERRALAIKMLKFIDDLLIQSLSIALNDSSAFEIIDDDHLQSSIAALTKLSCILHTSSMCEDEVRVGMSSAPSNNANFSSYLNKLREMQVRNWSLLYTLLKTGVLQNKDMFTTPETDLADYLAAVHQVLGLRKFCKSSNKIFLKIMRVELLKQNLIDNWEDYLGQVLFDLYGLKLGVGIWEVQDHGCPLEKLERRNTIALVEKISVLANRMPMKDLLKSDLKTTIEHMQQAIGHQTKSNQQMIHNLRNFNEYIKRPIHPLRLYLALSGRVNIDAVAVNTADSALAKHGWYFLLGMIAFCKFKGVDLNRRQTPGATDDLRIGATFLRQQLQFTPDRWDAWFRFAECYDYELDESVLWTADKMNKERADLVKIQRNAIHSYTLALSYSCNAQPDAAGESSEAIYELYHKFGMRMYASSREPFAMEPFQHADHERFFIQNMGGGTFKRVVHEQMDDYKVWKYAAGLFRKAMGVKPKAWKNSYMYAKCIWKMYQKPYTSLDHNDRQNRPSVEHVIKSLEQAVDVVSKLPRSRSGEIILEPHYKIVSVVHKLVLRGDLEPQAAVDILQRQTHAIKKGSHIKINDPVDYEPFIIETLTHLREKDKSNWQHRIIMRHARILFDEISDDATYIQATAAFGVLQKSMFTKTMGMTVWKCDAERPGRHHVYTEQYVRFMVKLLVVLKDRVNFEGLLRRIRKKGADFYHFNELWQTCCMSYLRLLRQVLQVDPVLDDVFKNVSAGEFEIISGRINEWAAAACGSEADEGLQSKIFTALKDAIELKKLNAGLMKAGPIDDLIADAYTAIYLDIGLSLPGPTPASIIQDRALARLKDEQMQMQVDGATDSKPTNPFSNILNPQSEQNSGTEGLGGNEKEKDKEKESTAARPRRAGVRRPDILRKAEQAVMRALEGPVKPTNGTKSLRASVSSGKTRASGTPNGDGEKGDGDVEMKEGDEEEEEGGDGGAESSAPGSVHDDADDESDLSDVPAEDLLDEDEEAQLMFPGLGIRRSVDQEVVSSGDDEDEEEEDEEEEEEEEEGGEEQEEGHNDHAENADEVAEEADDESGDGDEQGDVEIGEDDDEVAEAAEGSGQGAHEEEDEERSVIEAAGVPMRD